MRRSLKILSGAEGKSIIVSSNLRRALETATIGFWGRLQRTGEKIHVLSDLQEMSKNVDTMSLSKPKSLPPLLSLGAALEYPAFEADKRFDVTENRGQKEMFEPCIARYSSCPDIKHTLSTDRTHANPEIVAPQCVHRSLIRGGRILCPWMPTGRGP